MNDNLAEVALFMHYNVRTRTRIKETGLLIPFATSTPIKETPSVPRTVDPIQNCGSQTDKSSMLSQLPTRRKHSQRNGMKGFNDSSSDDEDMDEKSSENKLVIKLGDHSKWSSKKIPIRTVETSLKNRVQSKAMRRNSERVLNSLNIEKTLTSKLSGKADLYKKESFVKNEIDSRQSKSNFHKKKVIRKRKSTLVKHSGLEPETESNSGYNEKNEIIESVKKVKNSTFNSAVQDSKGHLSHEIFSDSKEQLMRDSLDLTAVSHDTSLDIDDIKPSQVKRNKIVKITKVTKSKSCHGEIKERPKRSKKSPKEFWLPRQEQTKDIVDVKQENKVEAITDSAKAMNSAPINTGDQLVHFKDLSKLEFIKNEDSDKKENFSIALLWKTSGFKCCVLKIEKKSEVSGRTSHINSYFGGLVVKGRVTLKIGDDEQESRTGKMFCVPPLTDWKAINKANFECVLYYWCGRF